jgi:hypothetical protein
MGWHVVRGHDGNVDASDAGGDRLRYLRVIPTAALTEQLDLPRLKEVVKPYGVIGYLPGHIAENRHGVICGIPAGDAREVAEGLWREHHRANLRENIQPTRTRADVVLRKCSDHSVGEVWLRET